MRNSKSLLDASEPVMLVDYHLFLLCCGRRDALWFVPQGIYYHGLKEDHKPDAPGRESPSLARRACCVSSVPGYQVKIALILWWG